MIIEEKKLDNPVWYSLSESHSNFAILFDQVKFYNPKYCPFGGYNDLSETLVANEKYSEIISNFYVVGNKPNFNKSLKINKELICNQMVLTDFINIEITETIIELQAKHKKDLFDLVNLVQPGYFKEETSELGSYYGIYKNEKLIAVTGERMKMNLYTEISAIVTHPSYTGKGYAKQLIAYTTNKIFRENKIPYLHVAENNSGAINLYEKLGFIMRRKISFWNLVKIT